MKMEGTDGVPVPNSPASPGRERGSTRSKKKFQYSPTKMQAFDRTVSNRLGDRRKHKSDDSQHNDNDNEQREGNSMNDSDDKLATSLDELVEAFDYRTSPLLLGASLIMFHPKHTFSHFMSHTTSFMSFIRPKFIFFSHFFLKLSPIQTEIKTGITIAFPVMPPHLILPQYLLGTLGKIWIRESPYHGI